MQKKKTKETIQLLVSINNENAKRLYKRLGFVYGLDQKYDSLEVMGMRLNPVNVTQ